MQGNSSSGHRHLWLYHKRKMEEMEEMEEKLTPMEQKVLDLFEHLSDEKILIKISDEVKAGTQAGGQRGKSQYVLDQIHKLMGDEHLRGCKNAEGPCLKALVEEYMTEEMGPVVIEALAKILPNLYFKLTTLRQEFSNISKVIYGKFPSLTPLVKEKLHLGKEAKILVSGNYSRQVVHQNQNLIVVNYNKVKKIIWDLKDSKDFYSQIQLVAVCVGSRLSEILKVSTYEISEENPAWIVIKGVSKDRGANREFPKPVVLVTPFEIIARVNSIRNQLEVKYRVQERKLDAKKLVSLVDLKLNDQVRATFGKDFTVHKLRSLYAHLAYEDFGKGLPISQTAFFSKTLGHKEHSLTTALSYQKFILQRDLEPQDPSVPAKLVNLEVKLRAEIQDVKDLIIPQPGLVPPQAQPLPQPLPQPIQPVIQKRKKRRVGEAAILAEMKTWEEELTARNIRITNITMRNGGFGAKYVGIFMRQWRQAQAQAQEVEEGEGGGTS